MPNPVAVVPFCRATATVGWVPPTQRHGYEPQWTENAAVDEEEPEIVRLFAAHYRTLLRLRRLTPAQRVHLTRLLALCEARLPECARSRPGLPVVSRQVLECLTAIRLYASGAQRALAIGDAALVAQALARIITQVDRAHDLLAAPGPPAEWTGPGSATPFIPKALDRCS